MADIAALKGKTRWPLLWRAQIVAADDPARAVALIQAALRAGYRDYLFLHRTQAFEPLWSYPPFLALLKPTK